MKVENRGYNNVLVDLYDDQVEFALEEGPNEKTLSGTKDEFDRLVAQLGIGGNVTVHFYDQNNDTFCVSMSGFAMTFFGAVTGYDFDNIFDKSGDVFLKHHITIVWEDSTKTIRFNDDVQAVL